MQSTVSSAAHPHPARPRRRSLRWLKRGLFGLAIVTRVVAYDRAGLGWSDPAPEPHDAYQSAQDLHTAVVEAGVSPPHVVAGHSYGGLVARAFTDGSRRLCRIT